MKISIRRAKENDLDKIVSLFERTVSVINSKHYSPTEIEAWLDDPTRSDRFLSKIETQLFYACVDENDDVVGFSSITEEGYLDLMYVSTNHQREGIGQLLMEQMLVAAKIRNCKTIEADVSITAVPFFERNGFEIVREQYVERNGVKIKNFKMIKTLPNNN
ncbi:MAG: GNAT family N-acetyltransferase [Chlorobiota bacterium]